MMKNNETVIAVISLGCDKNRVDTENIMYRLYEGGYRITDDYSIASVIIINTCAFIESAQKEAIDTIFSVNKLRSERLEKIIVTGCLPQRYGEQLVEMLPEVDAFIGINDYDDICNILENGTKFTSSAHKTAHLLGRIQSTPQHYAYLKIADGCDNFCTYCTIPSIRGHYRSTPIEALVNEAKTLVKNGVKEIILVAQDTTRYGQDLYGEYSLKRLLENLLEVSDYVQYRILYCYPELVSTELIEFIANEPRICNYLDIPLQHISDNVLKRMGRKTSKESICKLFDELRRNNIKIRTTFMVGFPGETDNDFNQLCEFVKEYKPYHIGIFAFSKESGTPAAKLKDQLPKKVKLDRVNKLGEIAKLACIENNKQLVGKTLQIIYEDIDFERNMFVGRTEYDTPEIDGLVYFTGNNCDVGNTYLVKIIDFDGYDLIGEMI